MTSIKNRAIIIGDSTNNTLSIIRSLGEAKIQQILILKCKTDICNVSKSKYLKHSPIYTIERIEDCYPILLSLKDVQGITQTIICSFDEAAMYIDSKESKLAKYFRTPGHGDPIGNLFNKDEQCILAEKCGLTVPKSIVYHRASNIDDIDIEFPILLKPLYSTKGEKSDIHICKSRPDLQSALSDESTCSDFIIQEFIDKEYEINFLGVRTDNNFIVAGGIKKLRHYPQTIGACSFGLFQPQNHYRLDINALKRFLNSTNYHGLFSAEFLYKAGKYYFMEVNFRNDGLAYAATAAGANLHSLYVSMKQNPSIIKIRPTYMMDYSIDFLYVKNKNLPFYKWVKDLLRTRCFININFGDLNPTFHHYIDKIKSKLNHQ